MSSCKLLVLDYDGVFDKIAETDKWLEEVFSHFYLSMATRRWPYEIKSLVRAEYLDKFDFIMADPRPKIYQIREIVFRYAQRGLLFNAVIFLDDTADNIEEVKEMAKNERMFMPNLHAILYGIEIKTWAEIISIIKEPIVEESNEKL